MPDFVPIPIVDLSQGPEDCATTVKTACESFGFFYIVNHGIPTKLIEQHFEQSKKFFELPENEKMKLFLDENHRGYLPLREERLDPKNSAAGDLKEAFYIGREIPKDHPEASLPLHGPNQWPDKKILPEFRSIMEEYVSAMTQLGYKLVELLAVSLGLEKDYFKPMFDRPIKLLRPLHYLAEKAQPEKGVFSAGAHSDYGMLTILATDSVPGLQISYQGEWMDVEYVSGAFVINLGDMLERWTNGHYKSTRHRVGKNVEEERYSTPFFFLPNFDTVVECLPSCMDEHNGAKYPPTTLGRYLLDKYNNTQFIQEDKQHVAIST